MTLRQIRKKQGLTQKAVAERAGIPATRISEFETQSLNLTSSRLWQIANAVGLPLVLIPGDTDYKFLAPHLKEAEPEKIREE